MVAAISDQHTSERTAISGTAQMTSYDTMGQMNTAFRNHEVPAARLPVKAVAAGLRSATHRLFC
jgi:hypothetical protein